MWLLPPAARAADGGEAIRAIQSDIVYVWIVYIRVLLELPVADSLVRTISCGRSSRRSSSR